MTILTPGAPLAKRFLFALLITFTVQLPAQLLSNPPRSDGKIEMASLHYPLVWQRTSPPRGQMEGPVLYQLLFSASGAPGTLAKFDTNPRHLANSLITDNGSIVAIGGMSVSGSTGIITFASGQTLPPSGAAGGSLAGTYPNPSIASNAINGGNIAPGQVMRSLNSLSDNVLLTALAGIGVSGSGQTIFISNTGQIAPAWALGGNAGTGCSTTPCTDFLGSTDNDPIEFRVNNQRAYRIEPATTTHFAGGFAPNVIGGFSGNVVTAGIAGATIAGGGAGGNETNTVSADFGTVGGGVFDRASGIAATVAGGAFNLGFGQESTVAGGVFNAAVGNSSTVPGGFLNKANGIGSFAAGQRATADTDGCFVWSDGTSNPGPTCGGVADRFVVEATGGTFFYSNSAFTAGVVLSPGGGAWASVSDRNVKDNFAAVEGKDILARVIAMPVTTWNYKSQAASIRHIGPMAQDFYATFKVGEDDKHITTIDEGGVALAAIQGLNQKLGDELREKDAQIAAQQQQIEDLQQQMRQMLTRIEAVEKAAAINEGVSRIADTQGADRYWDCSRFGWLRHSYDECLCRDSTRSGAAPR